MKRQIFWKLIFVNILLLNSTILFAQQDAVPRFKKNIIKINLSSVTLYDNALLFEYERIVKKNQSFSIQAGYETLPFETNDSLRLDTELKKSGYTVTIDYRFYLPRENKDPAPHGIYIAPFLSYNHFYNERSMILERASGISEPLLLTSKIDFLGVGAIVGYQFVLGKRWTIDCILLGPSITNYRVHMELTGNLTQKELDENLQQIFTKLANRFPLVGNLVDNEAANFHGKADSWNFGYRYSVHVGFRF